MQIAAADGFRLSATHFKAEGSAWIVVGSATGVPRGFYRRFAEYAQQQGVNVLTLDYRGIGDSRVGQLSSFTPDLREWSQLDLAAAVGYATQRGPTWLVGHSLAGHALGQLPNVNELRAAYVCGSGSGWAGHMSKREALKVWLLWNLVGPVLISIYGYQPMSKIGMGEDLPRSVFYQWRHWCKFPRYYFDDPAAQDIALAAQLVKIPIAACVSVDDAWAPPLSRDAFFSGFKNASLDAVDLSPSELGVRVIGHMGYFRKEVGSRLWPQILGWLEGHGLPLNSIQK